MRKYTLVDKATGEEAEADADMVELITGVEIGYIDWVLRQDGKFENGNWEVRLDDDGKRKRQSIVGWTMASKGERQGVTFSSCSGLPEKSSKRVASSHTLLNAILCFLTESGGRLIGLIIATLLAR